MIEKRASGAFLSAIIVLAFAAGAGAQDVIKLATGESVSGKIISHDDSAITLKVGETEKKYRWEQVEPKCAYGLLRRYIDDSSAKAHFLLAKHCVMSGLVEEAKTELRRCCELDPSFAEIVEKTLATMRAGSAAGEETPPGGEPAVNQEAVLSRQRQAAQAVNEKLRTSLKTSETEHFIIHSDFTNAADMALIRKWCERLYSRLSEVLDVKEGDRLWNGKCEIYLFLRFSDFRGFATQFDKYGGAGVSGGYFACDGRDCHIAIPRTDQASDRGGQKDRFLLTLLHEGSHAFLQLHGKVVDIKPWLHEGFAQFFELGLPDGAGPVRRAMYERAKEFTSKRNFLRFKDLRGTEQIRGNDLEAYVLSWSIVDYLINLDSSPTKSKFSKRRFAKFIALIKDGKTEEEAMKDAFGQTPDEVEQSWLRSIRSRR